MPRIAKRFLDCVVYIYPDQDTAASDEGFGGSGFAVARYVPGGYQTFVMTNRHVIERALDPVIRINRSTGGTESFPTNRSWWKHHPAGDDLSAYQLDISAEDHDQAFIWQGAFISFDDLNSNFGLGSDVAMLGRFVGLNGQVRNTPIARFGSLAAASPILDRNPFGFDQETIVIDCKSLPGYSGSPVVAFLPTTARSEYAVENSGFGPWLLGVDWMHYDSPEPVFTRGEELQKHRPHIKGNSGLMGAIPAWRIHALLSEFPEQATGSINPEVPPV